MFSQIRFQAVLVALVPILVLAGILAFVLATRTTTSRTEYWADHTRSVLDASQSYMDAIAIENRTAASAPKQSGPAFRARFAAERRATSAAGRRLLTTAVAAPTERSEAAALVRLGSQADRFLVRYAEAAASGDTAEMHRLADSPATKTLGDDLRSTSERFENDQRRLAIAKLAAYSGVLQRFSSILETALATGILLFIFTSIVLGTRIALRAQRLRRNAEILRLGGDPAPLSGNDELALADREYRGVLARLREEHNNATLLQRALLPQQLPSVPGIRIDASYSPSSNQSVIGGDWYDVFPLGDGRLGISVGDVAGHGLKAATTMALMRQSVRMAARLSHGPAEVLQAVNRIAYDDGSPLVTLFYGELSLTTGSFKYAVAGHPMPITVRASGDVEQLKGSGLIVGVERRVDYQEYSLALDAGSGIVLYTDGLIEQGRKSGQDYAVGMSSLLEVVNRQYYSASENIAHAIARDVLQGRAPLDDAAVLFIGITDLGAARAASSRTWHVDTHSASAARRAKRAFLWHLGEYATDGTNLADTELIFGELIGNVARHTPGSADITLEIFGDRAYLHVYDEGPPILRPKHDPETFCESGRGLLLVENLAGGVSLSRWECGNCISVRLPISLDRYDMEPRAPGRSSRTLAPRHERHGASRERVAAARET